MLIPLPGCKDIGMRIFVLVPVQHRLGTIHSLDIEQNAWLKEELRGRSEPEVGKDARENLLENVHSMHESDYPTEESKRKFICEKFKIDKNKILNKDEKLKEEVIKIFLDIFLVLALHKKRSRTRNSS